MPRAKTRNNPKKYKKRKEPTRQFDDLDRELIDVLTRTFCTMLKIPRQVSFVDADQMRSMYFIGLNKKEREKESKDLDYIYGSAYPEDRIIFLNPRLCKRSYQNLVDTLVHELLHIKFPNKKESQIAELEREWTGRYDYTIKKGKNLKPFINCKIVKLKRGGSK